MSPGEEEVVAMSSMSALWWVLGAVLTAGLGYLVLVAWRGVGIPALKPGPTAPTSSPAEARERFAQLRTLDANECSDPCCSVLLEPDGETLGTLLYFHGFTHCPAQFRAVGEVLRQRGYRVLVTRQPRHGLPDRLNRSLRDLEAEEIIEHVDRTVDIAAGFDEPLYALGFSGGGVQAAWAAATRPEVEDVLVISPATTPGWASVPIVRLFVRFRRFVPDAYIWWDPRTKAERVQSVHEYPGFPLPGIIPLLHMAIELGDQRVGGGHPLRRAVLMSNPNDRAVSRPAARWMMRRAFRGHANDLREAVVAVELRWPHDFIDPASRNAGDPSQVADVVLAAFGLTDDPSAGGLIAPGDPL